MKKQPSAPQTHLGQKCIVEQFEIGSFDLGYPVHCLWMQNVQIKCFAEFCKQNKEFNLWISAKAFISLMYEIMDSFWHQTLDYPITLMHHERAKF